MFGTALVEKLESNHFPDTSLSFLERLRQNDQTTWQLLVQLYGAMIYCRCRDNWNINAHDAENVGQEVFQSIARKIVDFDRKRPGSFRAWIRTIVDNKCRDFYRRNPAATGQGGSSFQRQMSNRSDYDTPSEQTELTDQAIVMREALKQVAGEFSDRDFNIFWRVVIDEREGKSVAAELEVTDNVVYLVCSRIRKRLKEVFNDLLDEDLTSEPSDVAE